MREKAKKEFFHLRSNQSTQLPLPRHGGLQCEQCVGAHTCNLLALIFGDVTLCWCWWKYQYKYEKFSIHAKDVWDSHTLNPLPLLRLYPRGTAMKYYFGWRALMYTRTISRPSRSSCITVISVYRISPKRLWDPITPLRASFNLPMMKIHKSRTIE